MCPEWKGDPNLLQGILMAPWGPENLDFEQGEKNCGIHVAKSTELGTQ